jgi:metallo-beta-lactamase family protein
MVMVGFQVRGTVGRDLVDGTRYIRLWGETIRVAAKIHTVGELSARQSRGADESSVHAKIQCAQT